MNRLPLGNTRGNDFHRTSLACLNGALAVEWIPQRIEHASDDGIPNRHTQQGTQGFDFVTFLNRQEVAEDDDPDAVLFQIQRQPSRTVGELDHFTGHHTRESINSCNTVTDFENGTDFADVNFTVKLLDLCLQDRCDLIAIELHWTDFRLNVSL